MYRLSDLNQTQLPKLIENHFTKKDWEEKRSKIKQIWTSYLGRLNIPSGKIDYEIIKTSEKQGYIEQLLRYQTTDGDVVPALLLLPQNDSHSAPSVLALHPTDEKGKNDIATEYGRENRQYALELVKRGFIVLAPDTITAGERLGKGERAFHTKSFYKKNTDRTAVGKMVSDHMHGISLLQQLSQNQSKRVGVIGHSLGGYNAYFLAGLDDRISCVVSSCGFATFKEDLENHRWGQRDWFSHIPRLSDDIDKGFVPFEFHEIASLVAPTPFFNWMSFNDSIFPHYEPAMEGMKQINDLYEWLGASDQFIHLCGSGGHDFPASIRRLAYEFLEKHLNANN